MSKLRRKFESGYNKVESEADTFLDRLKASRWTALMLTVVGLIILGLLFF